MPSKHPSEYTQEEVNMWLVSIGLGSQIDGFKMNGIDGGMLVTLTDADLIGDLEFSSLQARKFSQSLDFAKSLAQGGGGGASSEQMRALQAENATLREEVASLTLINKELQQQLAPNLASATAPPPQAYAPAPALPPQQHHKPAGAPVLKGAAGGALKGATIGAIGGAIAGDPRKGAKMGAAMGGAAGGMQGLGQRRRQRLGQRF